MTDISYETSQATDILQGAKAISAFLFGTEREVRKVYYLVESKRLPCFRLSKSGICARRSTLLNWMGGQEGEVTQ